MSTETMIAPEAKSQESTKKIPAVVKYVAPESYSSKAYSFQDANGIRSTLKPLPDQNIPNDDTVSINGKEVAIRYIAACSELEVEKQIKLGYPRDYRYQETDLIKMENGMLVVYPPIESNKWEFLELTNRNGTNPNRKKANRILFVLDDTRVTNRKTIDLDRQITKAKTIIYQIEEDEAKLRNVAQSLTLLMPDHGIDMNADPQSLIMRLKAIAEKNPKFIIDAYGGNQGDVTGLVWDAVENGVIIFTGWGFEWADTKEKINIIPKLQGKQNEDIARKKLVDFLTTQEGDSVRQLMEGIVKKRK